MRAWTLERESRSLEESQIRQLALAEATNDLVATMDADGYLLTLNTAGYRMLGLDFEATLSRHRLASFLAPRSAEQLHLSDIPHAIEHHVWHSEVALIAAQGLPIPASLVLVAHLNCFSHVEHFSVIIRDIRPLQASEEKRRQMLEQLHQAKRMETVGRLAGGIAHDFNNIITVIMGYAELGLLHQEPDSPRSEELRIILDSAQKASRLTAQLLDFSSKNSLEPQVIDVNEVIEHSVQLVRSLMGSEIVIDVHLDEELWPTQMGRSQLEQVILNLAVNSRDALRAGGHFSIRTANRRIDAEQASLLGLPGPWDYVELQIADNGCGIPTEHVGRIFEPFFTTKGKGKGTGMGLAAVYDAVRQNDGAINVRSKLGEGTAFTIHLPRVYDTSDCMPPHVQELVRSETRGGETILLVEDEPDIRALLANMLKSKGYRVLEAADGHIALELYALEGGNVQLLVSDMVLPQLDGLALSRCLQEHDPGLKVLLISGHTDELLSLQELDVRNLRLLSKPFSPSKLVEEVRGFLDLV
jgi:two-component system cell cycle sensor histidine kinase/response regulator CckA